MSPSKYSLSMVKRLSLNDGIIEYLQHKEDLFEALPVFSHLTKLELSGVEVRLDCRALLTILRRCPSLKTLKFCVGDEKVELSNLLDKITMGSRFRVTFYAHHE